MAEEIKEDSNCIIKAFENNNITIIKEEPNNFLFKATDIGKILDLTNVRVSVQNFDEDEKCVRNAYTVRGDKDMIFLTSRGVYRLLYNSKKPIAKQFRKWVGNILDDLIFNQGIELKNQLEKYHLELQQKDILLIEKDVQLIEDKEKILLSSYHKESVVYLIKIKDNLYKFGNTDNIKRRLSEHKREINKDIQLIYCIKSSNNLQLENLLKDYLKNTEYRNEEIINGKLQTELLKINDIKVIENKLIELNNELLNNKQIILELKAEILELKNKLAKYEKGENDKIFSKEVYKHFIQTKLEYNKNSKIELKLLLEQLDNYVKQNNIKFLQENMYAENGIHNFHGYSSKCKEELIMYIKEIYPNSEYKDQGVKRQFLNISLKSCTTHFHTEVYQNFINEFIEIGNKNKDEKTKAYLYKVRTQTIINKFNNYIMENEIEPLFKLNEKDALFNKELMNIFIKLTNCKIACAKYEGIDYQSFIGIMLKIK